MKSPLFLLLLLLGGALATAQPARLDLRLGVGPALLGTGDMAALVLENEVNYRLSPYLSTSASLGYGRSNQGFFETTSFLQGNVNFFVSPFRNDRTYDLRIGGGLSAYGVTDTYISRVEYELGGISDIDHVVDRRRTAGANVIVENTFALGPQWRLGLKLFTQIYRNGDIQSGALLKLGVAIL